MTNHTMLHEDPETVAVKRAIRFGVKIFIGIVIIVALFSAIYTVDAGERGVLLRS